MTARDESSSGGLQAVARDYADGTVIGEHCHGDGQFIYAIAGVMEIRAQQQMWLVPPQRALWIPPRRPHALRARGAVSLRTLYVAPNRAGQLFGHDTCGVRVPALARELILRLLDQRVAGDGPRNDRLIGVLFDELSELKQDGISLTMPLDTRLAQACARILARPSDAHRIDELARQAGASVRTLGRLARRELGCPLSTWRQQARVRSALPLLVAGESVTRVAQSLGYETPGAFTSMFRRIMGVSPGTYSKPH